MSIRRVHLVYPHGASVSCPDAIGRQLGKRLERRYRVIYHDLGSPRIHPEPGDVLLGHPTYGSGTCFRSSLTSAGWRRTLAMFPYHHANNGAIAFADTLVGRCDRILAITGNYWFHSAPESLYSHWVPKMVHLDLAVDRCDFPPVKKTFNPPGRRKFVFIGSAGWTKNPKYLSAIAKAAPDCPIAWIGSPRLKRLVGLSSLGYYDFSAPAAKALISDFDFMLTVSDADANPATILEAMAWGLIPVCTPESGYVGYPGIVNIPAAGVKSAASVLRALQATPTSMLDRMRGLNSEILDQHFNWDRFSECVVQAIESEASPPLLEESLSRRLRIRWLGLQLELSRLWPAAVRKQIAALWA